MPPLPPEHRTNAQDLSFPHAEKAGDNQAAAKMTEGKEKGVSQIVLWYVGVAGMWLLVADYFSDIGALSKAASFSYDILFIGVTGVLLHVLVSRLATRLGHVSASLRSSERKYRLMTENSPDGIYINRNNRIAYVNPAAVELFGARDKKELLGKYIYDLFPPESHDIVRNRVSDILEGRTVPLVTHKILRLDGEVREVEVAAVHFDDEEGPAIKAIFRDVSERKQKDAEIYRLNRIYAVLSQVNQAVVRITSEGELYQEVCNIIVAFGEFKMAWVGGPDEKTHEVITRASAGEGKEILQQIQIRTAAEHPEGCGLVGISLREGCTCITNDYSIDPRTAPWRKTAADFGYNSAMTMPIRKGGSVCAVLMVCSAEKAYFHSKEAKLLEEVAMDISFAIDHLDQDARRHAAEASQMQALSLLRATFESTTDGILVMNMNREIMDFNSRFVDLWRLPASWKKTRDYDELLRITREMMEDSEAFLHRIQEMYAHPEEIGFDILKFKDGRVFERHSHPQCIEGEIVGRVLSFRDVTQRMRAEESLRKREQQMRLLVEHLHAGVIVHDTGGRILLANPEASRLLGVPHEEIVGKESPSPLWLFTDEAGRVLPHEKYPTARVIATSRPVEGVIVGIAQGANKVQNWVLANAYPEFNANGQLQQVLVTLVDMTERKAALEALQHSEEKFRTLFSASRDAILLLDRKNYLDCNEAALEMFGCASKADFCAKTLGKISPPKQPDGRDSASAASEIVETTFKTGMLRYEWAFERFDGAQFPAEVSLNVVELEGQPIIQGVIRDISWRKEAEQQLRQLSRAVEQSPSAVVITDTQGNIEYVNPKFTNVTGYSFEEALGKNPRVLKSGETPPEGYKELWDTIASGREWHGELHNKKKNGELFWDAASICPITDESGAITHFVAVKEDITERKRTEEALKKSEEKFVKVFTVAPAVAAILTLKEARYVDVNDTFVQVSGYTRDEALGHTVKELGIINPEDLESLRSKLAAEGTLRNEELQYRIKDGKVFTGLVSAELIEIEGEPCVIYISLDITERKQMEEKFLLVQRMESIGALAGGMAHDLNNILAPIMMSASMLRDKKLPTETRTQLVEGIEESAQRGANIVNQVLTFARGVKGEHVVLDTRLLATQIGKIVRETFPKSIDFSLAVQEKVWNVMGDSTQLHQVFLNLCVNARDAMPEGGSLDFSVENSEVDNTFAFMVPGARPGNYVQFKLMDSGTGISKEIVARIFEPFFTTKEPGKGTGLGLSVVIGIIRSHGGFVKVESQPGKGSTFRVFIPATTDAVIEPEEAKKSSLARGRGETILVVDDEPDILQIIGTILQQNGWVVLSAVDGVEGIAAYLNHAGSIKALVTDMVMPNMDGLSLIKSIRKLDSDLPILVSSGYSNEESQAELEELNVNCFLKKPFNARQLAAEVFALLYGKPAGASGK